MSAQNRHQFFNRFDLDSHCVVRPIREESDCRIQRVVDPEVCEILIDSLSSQQTYEKRFHQNDEMNTSANLINLQFFRNSHGEIETRDLCFDNIFVLTSNQTTPNTLSPAINLFRSFFIGRISPYKSLSQSSFDSFMLDCLSLSNALDLLRTIDTQNRFVKMLAVQYNRTCVWLERFHFKATSVYSYPQQLCDCRKLLTQIWITKFRNVLFFHKLSLDFPFYKINYL